MGPRPKNPNSRKGGQPLNLGTLDSLFTMIKLPGRSALRTRLLVLPSGNDGLILAQPVSGFASMVQRKGLAMVRLK
jgi:hypothetical protein